MSLIGETETKSKIRRDVNELLAVVDWYKDVLSLLGCMTNDDSFSVADLHTALARLAAKMHEDIKGTVIVA